MSGFSFFRLCRLSLILAIALGVASCTNFDRIGVVPGLTGDAGTGVNKYLWRASLQTLSFMSPAGDGNEGIIVTDWTTMANVADERFKVRAFVQGDALSTDNIRIDLFRQRRDGEKWIDAKPQDATVRQLIAIILARAEQLRVEDRRNAAN